MYNLNYTLKLLYFFYSYKIISTVGYGGVNFILLPLALITLTTTLVVQVLKMRTIKKASITKIIEGGLL